MIVQSGVVRGLVECEYSARRRQCEEAAAALGVAALRYVDLAMLEGAKGLMTDLAYRRARHVVTENARTLAAADALRAGDLAAMGALMRESHVSQRDDFAITVPATDRLVAVIGSLIAAEGGARQTGGGFGGAVIALVRATDVPAVRQGINHAYRSKEEPQPTSRSSARMAARHL